MAEMEDAGVPKQYDLIDANDLKNAVCGISSGDAINNVRTYQYTTYGGSNESIAKSISSISAGSDDSLIEKKCLVDELAKKADILNRDQSIAAKEIVIGKPYVSPGPSAFKNAHLLKIDSEGNIWSGTADEDFDNATPDEEIVNQAKWTQATMGDLWLGNANSANAAAYAATVKTALDTGSTARYITFANGKTEGNKNQYINTNLKYTPSSNTIEATLSGNATTATAFGEDFGFLKKANTESNPNQKTATFQVTPNKAYLLFQTHSSHFGMYLISTHNKKFATILDQDDGLEGLSVNSVGNQITVTTSSAGRLSLIMVGSNV